MCTCNAQLQPHDRLANVCPPSHQDLEARILAAQEGPDDDHPYKEELALGGEA